MATVFVVVNFIIPELNNIVAPIIVFCGTGVKHLTVACSFCLLDIYADRL